MNKGKMYADGNFNMSYTNGSGCSGYLTMTNAEDYICVNGDLYVASYYNYSSLTNGTIEVKGNFTQKHTSYPNNFVPSGNHKVILSGGKLQKVEFATTQSYFNILEITKPLDTGYVFSRTPLWNELIEGKADTEAPTAPKNLKFVRSNSSSISMTWSASSDNAAIYCYYIYRNGERVGNTTKTEYIDNGLKSHTSYEYYIVACDTSGNLSEWSNILEASTDVDAFAPTQPANFAAKIQSEGVVLFHGQLLPITELLLSTTYTETERLSVRRTVRLLQIPQLSADTMNIMLRLLITRTTFQEQAQAYL